VVTIGNTNGSFSFERLSAATAGATLSLGSGLTINNAGIYSVLGGPGGIVNQGKINAATSGGQLDLGSASFTNQGTIAVANGDTLEVGYDPANGTITGFTFTNAGSLTASGATVNFYGTETNSGTLNITKSTVSLDGTFAGVAFLQLLENKTDTVNDSGFVYNNAGQMLSVGAGTALGTLPLNFTIEGGTIVDAGGGIAVAGGTLSGVTYEGTINLTATSEQLYIANGLTMTGAGGIGVGAIYLTGNSSSLLFTTSATLNNATVNLGAASGIAVIDLYGSNSLTLTLGKGLTIVADAADGTAYLGGYYYTGNTIINDGTIDAGASGGAFYVAASGGAFTNNGAIVVSNGDTLSFNGAASFTNTGTVSIGANSTADLSGALSNGGTIAVNSGGTLDLDSTNVTALGTITVASGGTLDIGGDLTTAQLLTLGAAAGTVEIGSGGTLNNTGATLSVGTGSALGTIALAGTIAGGTIADAGGGISTAGGTLSGVTYEGTINLSASGVQLYIANGLTVTGIGGTDAGTINVTGNTSSLLFTTSATLNNATVNFGAASATAIIDLYGSSGLTLTLGKGLTIVADAADGTVYLGGYYYTGNTIINDGTIDAGASGGTFNLAPNDTFTNNGTITVSNGDTLSLNGAASFTNTGTVSIGANSTVVVDATSFSNTGSFSVASGGAIDIEDTLTTAQLKTISAAAGTVEITTGGTLNNTGATLSVGAGSALGTIALAGTIAGGTIADAGGGISPAGGTLSGVTYEGIINLTASNAELFVANGLTVTGVGGTGAGTINLTGNTSSLLFTTSATLNNATVNLGAASATAIIDLYGSSGLTLTLGKSLTIVANAADGVAYLGGYYYSGNTIINDGTIDAGASGGTFNVAPNGTFTDNGTITVSNGDTLNLQPAKFTNLAGTTLTGGSYEAAAGSSIVLSNNDRIVTDNATIILSGAGSAIEALNSSTSKQVTIDSTLTTIGTAGVLELLSNRNLTTTAAFSNAGLLQLGGGTFTAASLTDAAGSRLLGHGMVAAAIANSGTIEASGGGLILKQAVTGTGTLQIDAGSALSLAATVASTQSVAFNGAGAILNLSTPSSFTNVISDLAAGDEIDLLKTAASAVTLNASNQLVVTNNGATVATFNLGGNNADLDFSTKSDGNGGTFLVVSPDVPPVTTVPETEFDQAGQVVAIGGVSISDSDAVAYNKTITVVLSDTSGELSATAATGATVAGAGTTTLTLSGSLAAVNTELGTLTYAAAAPGGAESDTITLKTSDGRGGSNTETIAVTINQPPVTTVPLTPELDQAGHSLAIAGVSVADADAVSAGKTITVVLSDTTGLLSATAATGATVTGAGTTSLTLSGSLSAVDTELASLTYIAAAGGADSDTITLQTGDGRGGSNTATIAVTINQPPVTAVPASDTVTAGITTTVEGVSVADADAVSTNKTLTVVLSDSTGELSATAETGGTVAGAGSNKLTLTGSLAAVNAELATLTYAGAATGTAKTASDTITVATTDGRGGSGGGTIAVTVDQASYSWKTAVSADWGTASDWSAGHVPGNFGTDATIAVAGTYTVGLAAGESFTVNNLTIGDATATLSLSGKLKIDGALALSAGALDLQNGADLVLGGAASGNPVTFVSGAAATLKLDVVASMAVHVSGFATGDTIDLAAFSATSDSYAGGVLTLFKGTNQIGSLSIAGSFMGKIFALSSDGAGGIDITLATDAAPVIKAPATAAATAGTAKAITGVSLTDADATAANETLTVTLTDKTGTLSATSAGGGTVTGAGSAKLAIVGSLSQVNADLATLTFKGAAAGTDTITVAAADNNGAVATPAAIAVTVASKPAVSSPDLTLFSQYVAAGFGGDHAGIAIASYLQPPAQQVELAAARH